LQYEAIFFLIFNTFLFSQAVEISAVTYSTLSGFTLYYQIQDRNAFKNASSNEYSYNQTWHTLQTIEALSLINVGYQIGLNDERNAWLIGTDILITGGIRWIVRDGIYQVLLGNSFFNLSNNTTAQFEKFGTPLMKITFLAVLLLFKYLILLK
jgi:hypothetical protein